MALGEYEIPGVYHYFRYQNPSGCCGYLIEGRSPARTKAKNSRDLKVGNYINAYTIPDDAEKTIQKYIDDFDFFVIKDKEDKRIVLLAWVNDDTCDRLFEKETEAVDDL